MLILGLENRSLEQTQRLWPSHTTRKPALSMLKGKAKSESSERQEEPTNSCQAGQRDNKLSVDLLQVSVPHKAAKALMGFKLGLQGPLQ